MGGDSRGRGRGSAPRLAGWRGGREGESEWRGASGKPRPDREPSSELSPVHANRPAAAARRRAASLSCKIWETSAHAARSLLSSGFLLFPFSSLLYLPSPRFTYRGRCLLLSDALTAAPGALSGSGGAQVGEGQPDRRVLPWRRWRRQ